MSEHFSLEELVRSATATARGIDNTPGPTQVSNLQRLCDELLEPVRFALGVPLVVNSGFRCLDLNRAVGGQPASAHLDGRAADVVPLGLDLDAAFDELKARIDLPYDQLILEVNAAGSAWLHLAIAREGEEPRRQALHLFQRNRAAS